MWDPFCSYHEFWLVTQPSWEKSRKSYGDYEVNYQLMEMNQWKEQDRIFLYVPFFQEKQEAIGGGVPLVLKKKKFM